MSLLAEETNHSNNSHTDTDKTEEQDDIIFNWPSVSEKKHKLTRHGKNNVGDEPKYNLDFDCNVWLRSCEEEVVEPITGNVSGKIPTWLNGSLIRNGSGTLHVGDAKVQHLFDGMALLHRFGIENGAVTYQCRFLQSDAYKKNKTANRIVVSEFGTKAMPDPCHTIFQSVASMFTKKEMTDNALVSVYPYADEMYAFTESSTIHRVNYETLETEKRVKVDDHVAIVYHTAHPFVVEDGTVFNLAMSFEHGKPQHSVVCFPASEKKDDAEMFDKAYIVGGIPARWPFYPAYMHSFGITENYFIIIEQPLSFSVPALKMTEIMRKSYASCFRWFKDEKTLISVISRKTGDLVEKFLAEPFFFFHTINHYEKDNCIVFDVCCFKDASVIDCLYVEAMKNMHSNPDFANMFKTRPVRFVIPMNVPKENRNKISANENLVTLSDTKAKAFMTRNGLIMLKPEKLCDLGMELPRINYDRLGKPYRYFYGMGADVENEGGGSIIKVDARNKTTQTWYEKNCYPSEPVFIAKPDAEGEDDGIVLASLLHGRCDTNHVTLIILDGKTMKEIARADFKTPSAVTKCFHGWFFPPKANNK